MRLSDMQLTGFDCIRLLFNFLKTVQKLAPRFYRKYKKMSFAEKIAVICFVTIPQQAVIFVIIFSL